VARGRLGRNGPDLAAGGRQTDLMPSRSAGAGERTACLLDTFGGNVAGGEINSNAGRRRVPHTARCQNPRSGSCQALVDASPNSLHPQAGRHHTVQLAGATRRPRRRHTRREAGTSTRDPPARGAPHGNTTRPGASVSASPNRHNVKQRRSPPAPFHPVAAM
jgi:hypothetical protein